MKPIKLIPVFGLATTLAIPFLLNAHKNEQFFMAKADSTVDLSTVITPRSNNYSFDRIGEFEFKFDFSAQIFAGGSDYIHDKDGSYQDESSTTIVLRDSIYLNDKPIRYWVENSGGTIYQRTTGLYDFPMNNGGVHSVVAVFMEPAGKKITFKVNLDYFPLNDITVTFKAGLFRGYFNNTVYSLSEDLSFISTLDKPEGTPEMSADSRIEFVNLKNSQELVSRGAISKISDLGESETGGGSKYHTYQLWTNIPKDSKYVNNSYPNQTERYLLDNILMNDRPLNHYILWGRGNSKDFTDLSDPSTQVAEYEMAHPAGGKNTKFDTIIQTSIAKDQNKYVIAVSVPNKLKEDFGISGDPAFSIREGSAWRSLDEEGQSAVLRINSKEVDAMAAEAVEDLQLYGNLNLYYEEEQEQVSNIVYTGTTDIVSALTAKGIENALNKAKGQIDAIKTIAQYESEARVGNVISLINAIPDNIEYNEECLSKVKEAKEALALLTDEQYDQIPDELITKLADADAQLMALDLSNYKAIVTQQIDLNIDVDYYATTERQRVQELIDEAKTNIEFATSKSAVDAIYNQLIDDLSDVTTRAEELNILKTNAQQQLSNIDVSLYREAEREEVIELIENGNIAISACSTIEEVNTTLQRVLAAINSIMTDSQMVAFEAAKASAVDVITAECEKLLKNHNYSDENKEALLAIRDAAIEEINNAKTTDALNNAKVGALNNMNAVPTSPVPAQGLQIGLGAIIAIIASGVIVLGSIAAVIIVVSKNKKAKKTE